MNADAYEITGEAFWNTWVHDRLKRRKEKRKQQERSGETHSDQSENTAIPNDNNKLRNAESSLEDVSPETEQVFVSNKRQRNSEKEYNESVASKRFKRSDGEAAQSPLFSFSCTVGTSKQFHVVGGRKPALSFICLDGDRELFYQMIMYLKNKLHCTLASPLT